MLLSLGNHFKKLYDTLAAYGQSLVVVKSQQREASSSYSSPTYLYAI